MSVCVCVCVWVGGWVRVGGCAGVCVCGWVRVCLVKMSILNTRNSYTYVVNTILPWGTV